VNETGVGLLQLQGNALIPVPNGRFFADKRIELMLPFGEANWLIGTEQDGLFLGKLDDDVEPRFEAFPTAIPAYFKAHPVYCGVPLGSGFYALGTHQAGLVIIDHTGQPIQYMNEENGLRNDLIWSMNLDQQGNLWLALDNGIAHISLHSPFSHLAPERSVLNSTIYQNKLYLGTTQGVFVSDWQHIKHPFQIDYDFQFVPGTKEQAWSFTQIDGDLLCAHIRGIFQLQGTKATKIADDYTWTFASLGSKHPKKLLAGTSNKGLILLEKKGGTWQKTKQIKGFDESSRYIAVDATEHIWVSHPYKGVFRMKLTKDLGAVKDIQLFTDADGLPSTTYNFVYQLNGKVLFATAKGIYKFNYQTGRFEADNAFEQVADIRKLGVAPGSRIWFSANNQAGLFVPDSTTQGNYRAKDMQILRKLDESIIYSINTQGVETFFGTPNGVIRFVENTARLQMNSFKPFKALVREVHALSQDSTLFWGSFQDEQGQVLADQVLASSSLNLPYAFNELRFKCAATWFEELDRVEFQYFLEGFDDHWSTWAIAPSKDYTNLPEGDYTFRVRARNAYGMVGMESSYHFTIMPPIYRKWWAYIIYIIAAASLVYWGVKLYASNLEREKKRLELLVQARTTEVVAQKEEIEKQNITLADQKKNLEELNEEKNHLIGILAHDLRNPLHQIKGMAAIMQMKRPDMSNEEKKYMGVIEDAVDHLNNMIVKILDLEAIESKKTNVKMEEVDLRHTLNVIVDSFQGQAEKKSITLVSEIEDQAHIVKADKGFAMQVFENLVSNAIKFSPANKRIFVQLKRENGKIRAIVKDEGPGISKEDMDKLFGKFQKLSARPTGGEKSTGLGLSIVKKYVEAMNGKVWCESEAGKGAAFIVAFEEHINH
ncbi:MAG: ATP-binding protein, partial [Flammeovirgaceae bacterium]